MAPLDPYHIAQANHAKLLDDHPSSQKGPAYLSISCATVTGTRSIKQSVLAFNV